MKRLWSILIVTALIVLTMVSVDAQVDSRQDVKIRSRTQAALAYDAAVDMYEAGRFQEAAVMFLKADLIEPSAAALMQAFKTYQRVGDKKMTTLLDKQFRFRYSDKRLADELNKDGLVCKSKWELEILKTRLSSGQTIVEDWLKGRRLIKLPENPYKR